MRLGGKATVVRGAGGGIGAAVSRRPAEEGRSVVAGDVDAVRIERLGAKFFEGGPLARITDREPS